MMNRESLGYSLVEVLVAIVFIAMAGLLVSRHLVTQKRFQTYSTLNADREALKRLVLHTTNCKATMKDNPCPTTGFVELKKLNRDGQSAPFISNSGSGTKFGYWTVRAECNATNNGIILRTARLKSSGGLSSTAPNDFIRDPIYRQRITWSNPKSLLFPEGLSLCMGARVTGLGPPQFESSWMNLPATINHNLGTDNYIVFPRYKAGEGEIRQDHDHFGAAMSSGSMSALGISRIVISEKLENSLKIEVEGSYRNGNSVNNNWTNHEIYQVKVRIWKIN